MFHQVPQESTHNSLVNIHQNVGPNETFCIIVVLQVSPCQTEQINTDSSLATYVIAVIHTPRKALSLCLSLLPKWGDWFSQFILFSSCAPHMYYSIFTALTLIILFVKFSYNIYFYSSKLDNYLTDMCWSCPCTTIYIDIHLSIFEENDLPNQYIGQPGRSPNI
jgi:hypothetical protein